MVTKFDHNLVMTRKPSTKVTLGLFPSWMIVSVIPDICQAFVPITRMYFCVDICGLEHKVQKIRGKRNLNFGNTIHTTIDSKRARRVNEYA